MSPGSQKSLAISGAGEFNRTQISSCAMPEMGACRLDETSGEAVTGSLDEPAHNKDDKKGVRNLCDLPREILNSILARLDYKTLFQVKEVSKVFKARIEDPGFNTSRQTLLTALHFRVRHDDVWRCTGYDLNSKTWMKLPPFAMLPKLNTILFKDHSICGAGGLLCVYVSTVSLEPEEFPERIVVFNPLSGRWRELPPLHHPRNPVLVHMVVASAGDSFQIITAGSARTGGRHLSQVTEVFDTRTSVWTVTEDVPGPVFALNEHQHGAYLNGILYCIAFLDGNRGRGLLAYSVEEGKWLADQSCPLPTPTNLNIMQVTNVNGEVVVFSEVEQNPFHPRRTVEHRVVILQNATHTSSNEGATEKWRNVMRETRVGSQGGLQIYPEYSCIPFGEGRLCIFNNIEHTGVIYDVISGSRVGDLIAPTWDAVGEINFYSFNSPTFVFEPSFRGHPDLALTHCSTHSLRLI